MEKLFTVDGQGPYTIQEIIEANAAQGIDPVSPALAMEIDSLKVGETTSHFHEAAITRIQ